MSGNVHTWKRTKWEIGNVASYLTLEMTKPPQNYGIWTCRGKFRFIQTSTGRGNYSHQEPALVTHLIQSCIYIIYTVHKVFGFAISVLSHSFIPVQCIQMLTHPHPWPLTESVVKLCAHECIFHPLKTLSLPSLDCQTPSSATLPQTGDHLALYKETNPENKLKFSHLEYLDIL